MSVELPMTLDDLELKASMEGIKSVRISRTSLGWSAIALSESDIIGHSEAIDIQTAVLHAFEEVQRRRLRDDETDTPA